VRTAGASQRPFLGEDVAGRELAGAGEGQVFAHGIIRKGTSMPGLIEKTRRSANPRRYAAQPALLGEIFGNCANQRV
jgi:hypothetical protein